MSSKNLLSADQLPPAIQAQLQRHLSAASIPLRSSNLNPHTPSSPAKKTKLPTPADAPENLNFSGNIISATCFNPYELSYRLQFKSDERDDAHRDAWELVPRRGSAALYDSIKHLARKESGWRHTIVGWTGEIKEISPKNEIDKAGANPMVKSASQLSGKLKVPPPVNTIGGTADRMSAKGDYSKPLPEQKPSLGKKERDELKRVLEERGRQEGWDGIMPVWLGDEDEGGLPLGEGEKMARWREYAERVLWPTFHYIVPQTFSPEEGSTLKEHDWWRDYVRFNNAFADAIVEIYKPGDIVWIHDYHLLILPQILRQRLGRDVYVGLFVHAPWPSSEIFKILSRRKQLLEGMLSANLVGFQSDTYKEHFVSCCKRILGYSEKYDDTGNLTGIDTFGAHCALTANPIGMDVAKVRAAVTEKQVEENMEKIRSAYGDVKIIVGRDRLDGVRGVLQKLKAFERFLDENPHWIGKVVLIQITSPSPLVESAGLEVQVSELVSKINGHYGSLHYNPVQHYPQYLLPSEYYALLRVADLGLITSVRDGMNTASIEYIISQSASTHGPIILSEFTGTAESIKDAIIVNPTNTSQVADAIKTCLEFTPEERDSHFQKLWEYVSTHTSATWNARFLSQLFGELERTKLNPVTPVLDTRRLLTTYAAAKRRLFMFDYDGTLTPIVPDPERATPTDRVIRTLKSLSADPLNTVFIISGRDTHFLSTWLGHIEELGLSAEHGCFLRYPGEREFSNLADELDMGWQDIAKSVFEEFTERTQGSHVEVKKVAVTWHYRRAEHVLGMRMAGMCKEELVKALKGWEVDVMEGKANLEVRPRSLNKGEIVRMLVEREKQKYGEVPDVIFCAGDDTTDEDMFRVLRGLVEEDGQAKGGVVGVVPAREEDGKSGPEGKEGGKEIFSVTVGPSSKKTEAFWHLLEPQDVVNAVGACVGIVDLEEVGVSRGVEGEGN